MQLDHWMPESDQAKEEIGITDIAVFLVESPKFFKNAFSIYCGWLAKPYASAEERAEPNQPGKAMGRRRFHHEQKSALGVHEVTVRVDE